METPSLLQARSKFLTPAIIGTKLIIAALVFAGWCLVGCSESEPKLTDQPFIEFRDTTSPFDSKQMTHFLGPAQGPIGESVVFSARGPLVFHLFRETSRLPHGGTVHLKVTTSSGDKVLGEWTDTVTSFVHPGYLKRLNAPKDLAMRVELGIIDAAAGGPSKTRPYTLILESWPLDGEIVRVADSAATAENGDNLLLALPQPECVRQESMGPLPEFIEEALQLDRGDSSRPLRSVRLFTAGHLVGVEIPPRWGTSKTPVTMDLYAKGPGDQSYLPICRNLKIQHGERPKLIVAKAPLDDESIWRLEISAASLETSYAAVPAAKVYRTKAVAASSTISYSDEWRHGLGYLCFDDRPPFRPEPVANVHFGGKSRLKIDLAELSEQLGSQQMDELHQVLLQGTYLWVKSCLSCRLDNLIRVDIGQRTYIHPGVYGPFGPTEGDLSGPADPRFGKRTSEDINQQITSGLIGARIGFMGHTQPYREVRPPARDSFPLICAAKADPVRESVLFRVQKALCSDADTGGDIAAIRVQFRPSGKTFCGTSSNIVACRADEELTEFNTRDYAFRLTGRALPRLGDGPTEVDFLQSILHEMGHWIGLDHIDTGDSIMASTVEQARCIGSSTVNVLTSSALGKENQDASPKAFKYRKSPN